MQLNLEKLACGRNVMQNLKDCFSTSVDSSSFNIDFACLQHQKYACRLLTDLLSRIRIHHFVRQRNRELLQLERSRKLKVKVNRKAKKVMHC